MTSLKNEVTKKELSFSRGYRGPVFMGTLYDDRLPVDRVHMGAIFAMQAKGKVTPKDNSIAHFEAVPYQNMIVDYHLGKFPGAETETWSRHLIPQLPEIYRRLQDAIAQGKGYNK
jgi:predicted NUDIX family phosphoesterase